jgi:hypothetical protein
MLEPEGWEMEGEMMNVYYSTELQLAKYTEMEFRQRFCNNKSIVSLDFPILGIAAFPGKAV